MIAAWPAFSVAVVAAATSLGYVVAEQAKQEAVRGTTTREDGRVKLVIPQSELVTSQLERNQSITVTRDGVTVTFSRDARGKAALCVTGSGHTEAELRALGEELGQRIVQILLAIYLAAILGFLICLGYPLTNFLLGLAISLHAISIVLTFTRVFANAGVGRRIGISLILPPVLYWTLYFHLFQFCTHHGFMPLRIRDKVVVINCWARQSPPKRGEWLACRFDGWSGPGYRVRSGYSLDPVLALAGQRVVFFPDRVEVNGQVHKRMAGMPESGEIEVPKNHCLIWPSSANLYANNKCHEPV